MDATPSSAAPAPVVATSERGDVYVAWRTGAGDGGDVRARRKDGEKGFEPEFVASDPAFGAVAPGQVAIGSDRSGNTVVAMLQGSGAGARITAAVYDRLPGRPVVLSSIRYRARKPLIKWLVGSENWGAQTFTVRVDGKVLGKTTRNALVSPRRARQGHAPLPGHVDRPPRPGRDEPHADVPGGPGAARRSRSRSAAAAGA